MDLFDVWQAIRPAIANQLKELKHTRASQQVSTPLDISGVLFEALQGWISHKALRKVQEERQLISKPLERPCTGTFTSSYGLPCVHNLKKLDEEGQALLLEYFHPHWHLKRGVAQPQPMLEPRIAPSQRNQRRNQPITSTRRESSGFEAVEAAVRSKAQPTCSRCHTLGHTMASKACPLRYEELLRSSGSVAPAQTTKEIIPTTVAAAAIEITAAQVAEGQIETGQTAAVQAPAGNAAADQTAEAKEVADHIATDQSMAVQELVEYIVVDQTLAVHTAAGQTLSAQSAVAETSAAAPAPAPAPAQAPGLRYSDPQAIYQRYVATREAWYKAQPRGSIKTNQQYRKAMGLPQRYDKVAYQWCLDWKQMGKHCKIQGGLRDWTKEEMMAYVDWSKAEDDRVEAQVAAEMEGNPFSSRRGMHDIWEATARDIEAQEAFYSSREVGR